MNNANPTKANARINATMGFANAVIICCVTFVTVVVLVLLVVVVVVCEVEVVLDELGA